MEKKLFKIHADTMNVPEDSVSAESSPKSIPAWDSLKHMRLLLSVEEAFGIAFLDDEIVEIDDTQSLLKNLQGRGVM